MRYSSKRKNYQKGLRDGLPIFLGYLCVSFTLGIAARNIGLSPFQATLMSLTNNASAGEFAAFGVIASGMTYFELAVTELVVNLRYFLMSCALSQKIDPKAPFFHRFFIAADVTDEVFGLSIAVEGSLDPFYTYGLITVAVPGWALGTGLGVICGNVMPTRLLSAMSIALYGMFIAVIIPPAKKNKVIALLIAVAMPASALFTYLPYLSRISSGFRIILLTVVIAGAAAIFFPVKESETPPGCGAETGNPSGEQSGTENPGREEGARSGT